MAKFFDEILSVAADTSRAASPSFAKTNQNNSNAAAGGDRNLLGYMESAIRNGIESTSRRASNVSVCSTSPLPRKTYEQKDTPTSGRRFVKRSVPHQSDIFSGFGSKQKESTSNDERRKSSLPSFLSKYIESEPEEKKESKLKKKRKRLVRWLTGGTHDSFTSSKHRKGTHSHNGLLGRWFPQVRRHGSMPTILFGTPARTRKMSMGPMTVATKAAKVLGL